MKISSAFIFKDEHGQRHICEKADGIINEVYCNSNIDWKDNLIEGLREISHDPSVNIETKIVSSPYSPDIAVIDTGANFYFAKIIDDNNFLIFTRKCGLGFGCLDWEPDYYHENNITVFCFLFKYTQIHCTNYQYIEW